MREYYTLVRIKILIENTKFGKDVEEKAFSFTGVGNANCPRHSETVWQFLRNLHSVLSYNPVVTVLGVYLKT